MAGPLLGLLLGKNPVTDAINTAVERLIPDKEGQQKFQREMTDALVKAEIQGDLAQIELNKVEAANPRIFVSGWRPYIGWICGTGFAVQFVIIPLVGYCYALAGYAAPPPLTLDPILYQIVFGILGINIGARTFEKFKGVSTK